MRDIKLTEADYHILSILLCVEINKLKRFYSFYGIDGLCLIAINNVYFKMSGFNARNILSIRHVADVFDHVRGRNIVDAMFKLNILKRCGNLCYARDLFAYNGLNIKDLKRNIMHRRCNAESMPNDFPDMKICNRHYMYDIMSRIHERVNSDLPEHINKRLNSMSRKVNNIDTECCFKVLNFSQSFDRGFIGFEHFVVSHLQLFHLSKSDFVNFIRNTDIMKIEYDRGIYYDAVRRAKYGMSPSPSNYEVKHARMILMDRINNCFIKN